MVGKAVAGLFGGGLIGFDRGVEFWRVRERGIWFGKSGVMRT